MNIRHAVLWVGAGILFGEAIGVSGNAFTKQNSIIVTKVMRENAQRNCERYEWAREHRDTLKKRLRPWLEISDEQLWKMLPSQGMPRSSAIDPPGMVPPGADEKHLEANLQISRGFGRAYRYHIDPFNHPWKVQSVGTKEWYPKNDFAAYYESSLDERRQFELGRGDKQFLKSAGPEGTETWVDDGTGMKVGEHVFFPAAHYAFRIWSELIDVTRDLAELYTLTNDPVYAYKAGVLLDRMADLYPAMDYYPWFKLGMEASTGLSGRGRVQGCIWETWTAQRLSLAYDQIYDALIEDEQLVAFTQKMAGQYQTGDKSSPQKIVAHLENNLLREFAKSIQEDKRIAGNAGMAQHSMTVVAIALDNGEETNRMLDWLFKADGGRLPSILVNEMSRDGFGVECGLGYASIPPRSVFKIAKLLEQYPAYDRKDLYVDYPKFRNALSAGESVRVAGGSTLHWGDGGRAMQIWERGYPAPLEMALTGYFLQQKTRNLREVLNAVGRDVKEISGDIYAAEPEDIAKQIAEAAEGKELWVPESFNSGGIGFGVLQAPYQENLRMVALNYGPMAWGHGHADRLGLHLVSDQVYMATDLGYPTSTGRYPPRIGWTSHTVSHNTVMVDDRIMERSSSFSGKAVLFADAGPVRVMDIDGNGTWTRRGEGHSRNFSKARPVYPQCKTYRRAVVMVDVDPKRSYYVDIFWVRGGKIHRLIQNGGAEETTSNWANWTAQEKGTMAGEKVEFGTFYDGDMNWEYKGSGLMFLDKVKRASPDRPFYVDWAIKGFYEALQGEPHLRVHNLTSLQEAATATGYPPLRGPKELRYLIRTVRGENALETQFVSVLEPYNKTPFIKEIRVLNAQEAPEGFHLVLEVALTDGHRDILLVTENGGSLRAGKAQMEGRVGWLRLNAENALQASALVDGKALQYGEMQQTPEWLSVVGEIVSLDENDPDNVIVQTSLDEISSDVVGSYLMVDNHQRADASYRIQAVLPNGRLNIGAAALDEFFIDDQDYEKGVYKNIAAGETFRINNVSNKLWP